MMMLFFFITYLRGFVYCLVLHVLFCFFALSFWFSALLLTEIDLSSLLRLLLLLTTCFRLGKEEP